MERAEGMGNPLSGPPQHVLGGRNFSLPKQWKRVAFVGQMMLGAFPMGKAIGLLSSHSPSFARREHASTFITEKALRSSVRSLQQRRPNRHHSIFAASIRPLPAAEIDRRSGANPFSLACLPSRSELGRTGPEGECTTNESHPEHALALPLLDLTPPARATFPLWQCPNAFPIGFDCIRIFEVLLGCGQCGSRGGERRPLEPLASEEEEEEMLSSQTAMLAPIAI